jgi:VanZ family protein
LRSLGFFRSPTKLLIAAWVIYLVYLSSIPRLLLAPSLPRPLVSPTAHVVAYFILATLIYMVLTRRRPGPIGGLKSAIRAMAIATAVGITVEVMQSFPPEGSVQLSDVVFNVAGTIAGLLVVLFLSVIGVPRRLIFAAIGTGMALVIVGIAVSAAIWNPAYPYRGDHWHSSYGISVCGVRQPDLPGVSGGVHSHGTEFIHIHPGDASEEGKNATLSLLFETHGGRLTRNGFLLPWGTSYRNGDQCPDGTAGEFVVFVNGVLLKDPTTYVLRDQQTILIMFRSVGYRDQA